MKILILGRNGQVGRHVIEELNKYKIQYLTIARQFYYDEDDLLYYLRKYSITHVVNCAAFTKVDAAHKNVEAYDANVYLPFLLAKVCNMTATKLIHISSDYVFDGCTPPYSEWSLPNPVNEYGRQKINGDKNIIKTVGFRSWYILRVSWVYSEHGINFVKTMLNLLENKKQISVVDDQIGCPTSAKRIAETIVEIIRNNYIPISKVYNFSGKESMSWYEFAQKIDFFGKQYGLIRNNCSILPIKYADYRKPNMVDRPENTTLDNSLIRNWIGKVTEFDDDLCEILKRIYKNTKI